MLTSSERVSINVAPFKRLFFSRYFKRVFWTLPEYKEQKKEGWDMPRYVRLQRIRMKMKLEMMQMLLSLFPGKFSMEIAGKSPTSKNSFTSNVNLLLYCESFEKEVRDCLDNESDSIVEYTKEEEQMESSMSGIGEGASIVIINRYVNLMESILGWLKDNHKYTGAERKTVTKVFVDKFLVSSKLIKIHGENENVSAYIKKIITRFST